MSPILNLMTRVAEDTHSSLLSRDSDEQDDSASDHGNGGRLPWWAILVIVYVLVFSLLFFTSLIFFWKRENERKKDGHPFRTGHVFWKAFTVGTGLWTWIWTYKRLGWCGSKRKHEGAAGAGTYETIGARKAADVRISPRTPGFAGAPAANPNTFAEYGISSKQSTAHTSYLHQNNVLKSAGYNPMDQAFTQHNSIQMSALAPSPSPSPNPHQTPPPPPYVSTPPPVALYGQDYQTQYNGASY